MVKSRTKPKQFKQKLIKAIAVMFCMGVIVCCIIGMVLTFFIASMVKNRPNIDISNLNLNYTTIIYANNKQNQPYEVERIHSVENRIWVNLDEIPSYVGNAAIAVEDQRFMHHHGVDFKRTIFAFLNEMFHFGGGRQGGSTITQQLIKNITGDNKVQATRKLREMISALYLEKQATKEE
ncbi:MAG: transglycosylase domain-containing protein, partial [Oscillospiraceae bacterium]